MGNSIENLNLGKLLLPPLLLTKVKEVQVFSLNHEEYIKSMIGKKKHTV